jgi:L-ascorbate metabolism protein UlaG (beta-lactamase superfamily)
MFGQGEAPHKPFTCTMQTTRIRFLGVAGYEIVTPRGQHILFDPFLDGQPQSPLKSTDLERVDLILVSHAAWDHMGDTEAIARRTGAPVLCSADVKSFLIARGIPDSQVRAIVWGLQAEVAGLRVQPVECHHWSAIKLPDGRTVSGVPLGFVLHIDSDTRFYHYGDTAIFGDMKLIAELYRPTIGCVGVANPDRDLPPTSASPGRLITGEMSPREAALAAQWLGLETVFPCHYINADDPDVHEFHRHLEAARARGERVPRSVVLRPGETFTLG